MGRNDELRPETLLLGEHVQDQVTHTVAVAELVVVPAVEPRVNKVKEEWEIWDTDEWKNISS